MPRRDIDYQKTIIYKIVCNDLSIKHIYVGHTTDFTKRKGAHKRNTTYEKGVKFNYKLYKTIRENGGWDNYEMIEVEKYPCNDGNEARKRERYWYEKLNANLNTNAPSYVYDKEKWRQYSKTYREKNKTERNEWTKNWRITHIEEVKDYSKKYYELNDIKIKERANHKDTCEICGSIFNHNGKTRHERTKNHLDKVKLIELI